MRYAAYQIEHEIQKLMPLSEDTKLAINNGRFVVADEMLAFPSCSNQDDNDSETAATSATTVAEETSTAAFQTTKDGETANPPTTTSVVTKSTTVALTTDKAVETAIAAAKAFTKADSKFEQMQSELDGYKRRRILASSAAKKFAGSPPERKP